MNSFIKITWFSNSVVFLILPNNESYKIIHLAKNSKHQIDNISIGFNIFNSSMNQIEDLKELSIDRNLSILKKPPAQQLLTRRKGSSTQLRLTIPKRPSSLESLNRQKRTEKETTTAAAVSSTAPLFGDFSFLKVENFYSEISPVDFKFCCLLKESLDHQSNTDNLFNDFLIQVKSLTPHSPDASDALLLLAVSTEKVDIAINDTLKISENLDQFKKQQKIKNTYIKNLSEEFDKLQFVKLQTFVNFKTLLSNINVDAQRLPKVKSKSVIDEFDKFNMNYAKALETFSYLWKIIELNQSNNSLDFLLKNYFLSFKEKEFFNKFNLQIESRYQIEDDTRFQQSVGRSFDTNDIIKNLPLLKIDQIYSDLVDILRASIIRLDKIKLQNFKKHNNNSATLEDNIRRKLKNLIKQRINDYNQLSKGLDVIRSANEKKNLKANLRVFSLLNKQKKINFELIVKFYKQRFINGETSESLHQLKQQLES